MMLFGTTPANRIPRSSRSYPLCRHAPARVERVPAGMPREYVAAGPGPHWAGPFGSFGQG